MDGLRVCIDQVKGLPPSVKGRLALVRETMWRDPDDDDPEPVVLEVGFLDGDPGLQRDVLAAASEWSRHANVDFVHTGRKVSECEIRVSFRHPGSWSWLGKDRTGLSKDEPTMNFGWLTKRSKQKDLRPVVLHEFGHALGCIHEHSHPEAGIPWNKKAVYAWYKEHRQWSREMVDAQVLKRYVRTLTVHSPFDCASIMLYPIPRELTDGVFHVGFNSELSETDKAHIAQMYPGRRRG